MYSRVLDRAWYCDFLAHEIISIILRCIILYRSDDKGLGEVDV